MSEVEVLKPSERPSPQVPNILEHLQVGETILVKTVWGRGPIEAGIVTEISIPEGQVSYKCKRGMFWAYDYQIILTPPGWRVAETSI